MQKLTKLSVEKKHKNIGGNVCPLTGEVMFDPVRGNGIYFLDSSEVYERSAIEGYILDNVDKKEDREVYLQALEISEKSRRRVVRKFESGKFNKMMKEDRGIFSNTLQRVRNGFIWVYVGSMKLINILSRDSGRKEKISKLIENKMKVLQRGEMKLIDHVHFSGQEMCLAVLKHVKNGDKVTLSTIDRLLDHDLSFGKQGSRFYSKPLSADDEKALKPFLGKGAEIKGLTVFQFVCQFGSEELVQKFVGKINVRNGEGEKTDRPNKFLEELVAKQSRPRSWKSKAMNALLVSKLLAEGDKKNILSEVILFVGIIGKERASKIREYKTMNSLLHIASEKNYVKVAEYLMTFFPLSTHHTDKNSDGSTALHLSVKEYNLDIFKLFVKKCLSSEFNRENHGIDYLIATDKLGRNILDLLAESKPENYNQKVIRLKMIIDTTSRKIAKADSRQKAIKSLKAKNEDKLGDIVENAGKKDIDGKFKRAVADLCMDYKEAEELNVIGVQNDEGNENHQEETHQEQPDELPVNERDKSKLESSKIIVKYSPIMSEKTEDKDRHDDDEDDHDHDRDDTLSMK